jgi:hypothetical protein
VEEAVERRLSELPSSEAAAPSNDESSVLQIARPQVIATPESTDLGRAKGIDRASSRSPLHFAIATGSTFAMSLKRRVSCAAAALGPPPPRIYPAARARPQGQRRVRGPTLSRGHHRAVHRPRDERAWWRQAGYPIKVARRLWKETRGKGQRRSERLPLPQPRGAAASSDPKLCSPMSRT